MAWTKGDIVQQAFGELSLASRVFDLQAEEQQDALKRLNMLMGTWEGRGIKVGFNFGGDLNADSGLPDDAVEAVALNLALRLAPGYGKQPSPLTMQNARLGFDTLLWNAAQPPQQVFDNTMPRGAGNKPWRRTDRPFMPTPDTSPLDNTDGGDLEIME